MLLLFPLLSQLKLGGARDIRRSATRTGEPLVRTQRRSERRGNRHGVGDSCGTDGGGDEDGSPAAGAWTVGIGVDAVPPAAANANAAGAAEAVDG
jgi:hypothetical protein